MKPFKFNPILKSTLWGGEHILRLKGIADGPPRVGESWEISDVPGRESRVAEGEDAGMTLRQLIAKYGERLLGQRNLACYGGTFPLLVKFLSAQLDLSIQVHPDDDMAHEMGHRGGKTEMWYVVDASPGTMIGTGFSTAVTPESFAASLEDGTICNLLRQHESHAGDCFFIPAGRIHSLGAGNFVIEVQQASDDSFRIYDFDRTDANGNRRELHIDQARRALHYESEADFRTCYVPCRNRPVTLTDSPQFTTRLHQHDRTVCVDYSSIDSFVIFVAFSGSACLTDAAGNAVTLRAGESLLFPAENTEVTILPDPAHPFGAIEAFVP